MAGPRKADKVRQRSAVQAWHVLLLQSYHWIDRFMAGTHGHPDRPAFPLYRPPRT